MVRGFVSLLYTKIGKTFHQYTRTKGSGDKKYIRWSRIFFPQNCTLNHPILNDSSLQRPLKFALQIRSRREKGEVMQEIVNRVAGISEILSNRRYLRIIARYRLPFSQRTDSIRKDCYIRKWVHFDEAAKSIFLGWTESSRFSALLISKML